MDMGAMDMGARRHRCFLHEYPDRDHSSYIVTAQDA